MQAVFQISHNKQYVETLEDPDHLEVLIGFSVNQDSTAVVSLLFPSTGASISGTSFALKVHSSSSLLGKRY